jgi:hypothetical protein
VVKKKKGLDWKGFWLGVGKWAWLVVRLPYYSIKTTWKVGKKIENIDKERKILKKRSVINARFEEFEVLKVVSGEYLKWRDYVFNSDSQIGIVLGARGNGKTAFGVKFLENYYSKNSKACFAMGFRKEKMPSWIHVVSDVGKVSNDSVVLIDEGGVLFNSRSSMSNANKLLSSLMMVARHKNISIVFISQNSANLEVNILRQADFLVMKPSSLMQKEFERKIVRKIYDDIEEDIETFREDKGLSFIYSGKFRGFVSNPLPSFWEEGVSKSFK